MVEKNHVAGSIDSLANSGAPKKRILIAEDDMPSQELYKAQLSSLYELDIVDSGQQAIILIASNHYDLIIMDEKMPGMDGSAATKIIRDYNPHVPVLGVTAFGCVGSDFPESIKQVYDTVVFKPYYIANLLHVIQKHI